MKRAFLIFCVLLSIGAVGAVHYSIEGIKFADDAYLPRFLELDRAEVVKADKAAVEKLALAGYAEAKHLVDRYRTMSREYQFALRFLAWVMLVQAVCLVWMAGSSRLTNQSSPTR